MSSSWIKLYKSMKQWEWWDDPIMVKAFLAILLECNWKPTQWQGIKLNSGQFVTSLNTLARELHVSIQQVRTILHKLCSTGEITIEATNRYSIITVQNWTMYQMPDNEADNTQINKVNPLILNELTDNSNRQSTNNQHTNQQTINTQNNKDNALTINDITDTSNKQARQKSTRQSTTVEEYIEYNKESIYCVDTKESNTANSTSAKVSRKRKDRPDSPEEVIEYCKSRNNNIDGQLFYDKMEARGWVFKDGRPVKDWRACIRTWERYNAKPSSMSESWRGKTSRMEEKDINGEGFL